MANEVNITMTAKDLASGKIKGVGDQAKTSMDKLRGMRGAFLAVGAAGGAIVGALGLAVKSFAQTGDEIQKMSMRTALTTEVLSEYKFALEQSGSTIQGFEKSIRRMSSFIQDGRDGLTTTTDALDTLGVSVKELEGLGVEDAFVFLSSALADVEDDITQAALAQDLFGRSGTALLPLLAQGADGIAALREEAQDLGIVFDQDMADSAARVVDAQNTMRKSTLGLQMAFAEHLAPALSGTLETIGDVISKVSAFSEKNPVLTKTIAALGLVLGTLLVTVGLIGLGLPILATGFGLVAGAGALFTVSLWAQVAAWIALNAATGGIIIAIGAVVAGVVLLIMNWETAVRAIKIGVNAMSGAVEHLANYFIDAANKIIKAMNKIGSIFGKEIDEIASVEIPRFNTAMEEMADVSGESTEEIIENQEEVTDSMREELEEQVKLAKEAAREAREHTDKRLIAEWEQRKEWNRKLLKEKEDHLERERLAEEEAARASKEAARAEQDHIDRRLIAEWKDRKAYNRKLFAERIAHLERERLAEEEASEQRIAEAEAEAARLTEVEREKRERLKNERAKALADTLKDAELRMDAVKALREENSAAFARIKAEVDLLPANIQAQTSMGMSREALDNRAGVMRAFKDSQNAVTASLAAATSTVQNLRHQISSIGTEGSTAQLEIELAAAIQAQSDLLQQTQSEQFKGTQLGAVLAPKGGYGTSAPPMIPGMTFGAAAATQGHTTIIFNGDTYGLDDFTDKVNEGITVGAQRGIWGTSMWDKISEG